MAGKKRRSFERWWHEEGSGMPPLPGEDAEQHVKRISAIAWSNSAYKTIEDLSNMHQPLYHGDLARYRGQQA